MARAASAVLLVLFALAAIVLSVANRQAVTVTLDPFRADPELTFELPLYALVFGAVAAGVVLGALVRVLSGRRPSR